MKKVLSLCLALCLAISLAACGAAASAPAAASASASAAALQEAPYPVTVTDQAGRTVTIEQEPETLVSGYYISTSLLIALGQQDKLVGIEAGAAKRAIYALSAPQLAALPSVGSAKEFDLEGCAALEPDLVILPKKLKDAAAALEELGIPVLLVNPENEELADAMRTLLAEALDCAEQADALAAFTAGRRQQLADALADTETPTVYLAGNSALLSTAGGAMYQSSLIALAGGQNVAAGLEDTYWAEVSYEQLLDWNPAYIILASDASYTVEEVLADPNLAGCDAVREGRVYQLPGKAEAWDSPVPGSILGAVWLADVLHDEVTESDAGTAAEEFYETFYGFDYSAA